MTTVYNWVQGDHETVTHDLSEYTSTPDTFDLTDRNVHFVLRHYTGEKVADVAATVDGTTVTVDIGPDNLSRSGTHTAEWRITGGDSDPTTYPKEGTISVKVRDSVHDVEPISNALSEAYVGVESIEGPLTGGATLDLLTGTYLDIVNRTLIVDLDGQEIAPDSITVNSLSIGTEPSVTGYGQNLLINTSGELESTDTNTQLDPSHTNPTYDTEENGIIDANVDNDSTTTEELLLSEYPTAADAPSGSGTGIVGITSDGNLLMEDGK